MNRFLLVLLLGFGTFLGSQATVMLWSFAQAPAAAQPAAPEHLAAPISDVLKLSDRFEQIARKVSPAVVYVEVIKPGSSAPNLNSKAKPIEESGSGVIIRREGAKGFLVLTNNHVISQATPEQITINLADGKLVHPQQVWTDPESDVAVMSLEGVENLASATLGNSDEARVGQWVLAIGSPFGLNQTVTHGIVSARERGQIGLGNTIRIKDFLQTDAAINPGSSGGPLVNLDGQVIGINTAIASQNGNNSGVAFSISINLVKRIMKQLLENGAVTRGYLGMQLAQSFEAADALRLGLDRVQGALVETIYQETPAAAAGLRADDVILQLDKAAIRNENQLINMVSALQPGSKVRIHVWRERKLVTVEAVVGEWAKAQNRFRIGR
jgi:S1-C subfamily serine protease